MGILQGFSNANTVIKDAIKNPTDNLAQHAMPGVDPKYWLPYAHAMQSMPEWESIVDRPENQLKYNSAWEDLQRQQVENARAQQSGGLGAQANAQQQMALSGMSRFGGSGGGAGAILGSNMANQAMQQRQQLAQGATQQQLGIGIEGERQRADINKYNLQNRLAEQQAKQQFAMDKWRTQQQAISAAQQAQAMD